ncbi:MAG: hypothetical protein RMJ19_13415 [Gemmatales bacterium]|nr:hypothetical protein [Gemmatales bacterium]MDW8176669.1 hypothetical protein [Gemmatales bacterium]
MLTVVAIGSIALLVGISAPDFPQARSVLMMPNELLLKPTEVLRLAFSPDSKFLLINTSNRGARLELWDWQCKQIVKISQL